MTDFTDFGRTRAPRIPALVVVLAVTAAFVAFVVWFAHEIHPTPLHTLKPYPHVWRISALRRPTVDLFAMGKQAALLEIETAEATKKLRELEAVVYFTSCVEQRSNTNFKLAYKRGLYNEICRNETNALAPKDLSAKVAAIIAEKKAKR